MAAQEYGQALHGRLIDSQTLPLAVDWPSPVRDVRFGGSFALLLDGECSRRLFPASRCDEPCRGHMRLLASLGRS